MSDGLVSFDVLAGIVRDRGRTERSVTAIAGAPGSGKSTLAERLSETLNAHEPGSAAVFPLDGYHLDDGILEPRGWRPRKGAPHTFDVAGFSATLARLRAGGNDEMFVPVFDRRIEIARNSARAIPASVRHLIVEGNYLLLKDAPWSGLIALFDTTVFLDVPMDVLRRRLEERWQHLPPGARTAKLQENDLPNAEKVVHGSRAAEFTLHHTGDGI